LIPVDAPVPKGPSVDSVSEKPESPAGGAIVKRPRGPRKTAAEKRIDGLAMAEWATRISEKHPGLVNQFLQSKDERVQFETWRLLCAYRWGTPTGRVEVDLRAAARMLAASRGISEQALMARAAKIVDGVTTVDEPAKTEARAAVVVEDEPE
jgi:hypothetical protein